MFKSQEMTTVSTSAMQVMTNLSKSDDTSPKKQEELSKAMTTDASPIFDNFDNFWLATTVRGVKFA